MYLKDTKGRVLHGSTEEQIDNAKTGFKYMERHPEDAYKCGPHALNSILREKGIVEGRHPLVEKAKSSHQGTNLLQLRNWARECGLNYQIAKRAPGAPVLMPSVVHWKVGHFGAVLGKHKERFHVSDPTFDTDGNFWLTQKAIDTESDGYFLVQAGSLPIGWEAVSDSEGSTVWGKGQAKGRDQDEHTPPCPKIYKCGSGKGMATATAFKMLATLQIEDTPLEYSPPVGPNMNFTVTYNHLETNQPSSPAFTTFGPDWNFNWLSYLTVDASGNATVRVRGGGSEVFNYTQPNNITNPYGPNLLTQAILAITGKDTYQRQLPDGSIEVFDQPDGAGRFFMTKVIDPQGNTVGIQYNSNFRIDTITDAIGQVTEIDYLSNQISNVGYYKVKTISDPFSREANFAYDSSSVHITSITDVISVVSSFEYDPNSSFIFSMSTPYGVTSFQEYTPKSDVNHPNATPELARGIRFTFPDSTGMVVENWLNYEQRSYYWDRHALELYPGDPGSNIYDHCEQTQWQMINGSTILESSVPDWVKPPLESRITYSYEGQVPHEQLHFTGGSNKPISVSRTIQGDVTQASSFAYNAFGQMTKSVDPIGRTMSYFYSANNVDLLEARQTRSTNNDLMGKWQYNNQHLPVVYIDGSGQKTLYSYNPQGQILTVTDADNKVTTYGYTNYYLTSIDGPLTGDKDKTTISYDSYGRVFQVTDSVGYTIQYEYDAANRPTKTTYPDGTFEENYYNRLDLVAIKDRIGRWTTSEYNSLDEIVKTTDPLGRATQYVWCSCGSLVSLIDGAGNKTVWHHDLEGRMIEKIYSNQTSYRYEYEDSSTSGRLKRRIDALNQKTDYVYNVDDTLSSTNYSDLAVPGSTSNTSMTWDPNYRRIATVTNGWGTVTYSYNAYITNPLGTAITGGGMLHTVTDNVIANSGIEYFYDVLGRTTKREINGGANSVAWTYDAMSRVLSESNALGGVGYEYVDQNATGGDRGTTRLAKITYPLGGIQEVFFEYYGNSGDQRLQRISNRKQEEIISEFDYAYDQAGQITQWHQLQNQNKLCYNLVYDKAGQLVQARAGAGSPLPPYAREYQYSYDPAANRTGVQTSSVETIKIGGSRTTGDVLTVTLIDPGLTGGQQAISYTASSTDTLSTIALNLATAINQNSNLQDLGVNANSSGTLLKVRSVSKNITTLTTSTSAGASETMQVGFSDQGVTNAIISGSITAGDTIKLTVRNKGLLGGIFSVTYTVQPSDTLSGIAAGLKTAINSEVRLRNVVDATSGSAGLDGVLSLNSPSVYITSYSVSTNENATETVVHSMPTNIPSCLIISPNIVTNDDINLQVIDPGIPSGIQTVSYRVLSGDSPASVATAIATLINTQTNLVAAQVSATASASVITLASKSPNQTRYRINYEDGEWFNAFQKNSCTQTVNIEGTTTAGDTITINTYHNGVSPISFAYTVPSGATSTSIATALATAINGNTDLQSAGFSASSSSSVLYITSSRVNAVFTATLNSGATETVKIGPQIGSTRSIYNNVNELLGQHSGGSMEVDWSLDLPPKSTDFNTNTILLLSPQPNSTTYNGTAQLTFGPNVGGNTTANLRLGSSDLFTITINDARLPGGNKSFSVTRTNPTSTIGWVTGQLVKAITGDADLKAIGIKARSVANASFENSLKFRGDAEATPSTNIVEFNQQLSTPAPVLDTGLQTNFTYDANGNMTSDGTNTYKWDAEDRLIEISYPGSAERTQFVHDGWGRTVKIVETVSGVQTTRQFVCTSLSKCEERDANGALKKQSLNREKLTPVRSFITPRITLAQFAN